MMSSAASRAAVSVRGAHVCATSSLYASRTTTVSSYDDVAEFAV
jgi:hypothetical protein